MRYTAYVIRIKLITPDLGAYPGGKGESVEHESCLFLRDATCRHYDWLVVYDDFPRGDVGSIRREQEPLACPPEHTLLVTQEPPTIKLYPRCYTHQFGHVLTTHQPRQLPHPHRHMGKGCLFWQAGYPLEEVFRMPEYRKTRLLSTVCSDKQMRHTEHFHRYALTRYIAAHLSEMDWYGRGVRELTFKYEALNDYRYHLAVENYIGEGHWTDKISDPLLGLCLTFYAGDPRLGDILPPESFVPIPLHEPEETLAIMRRVMQNDEYEKRLPAIREARRLLVTKYNFYSQTASLIQRVIASEQATPNNSGSIASTENPVLSGRHRLRCHPLHALEEAGELLSRRLGWR